MDYVTFGRTGLQVSLERPSWAVALRSSVHGSFPTNRRVC